MGTHVTSHKDLLFVIANIGYQIWANRELKENMMYVPEVWELVKMVVGEREEN